MSEQFCGNCGAPIPYGAKFCGACGNSILIQNQVQSAYPATSYQSEPASKSHNTLKYLALMTVIIFAALIVIGASNGSNQSQVYITNAVYTYNCSNCPTPSWTYSVPVNITMNAGSTFTNTGPISLPPIQCVVTFESAYATTPGFLFSYSPIPFTIPLGQTQTPNETFTLTAPSQQYSGPLDVSITLISGC